MLVSHAHRFIYTKTKKTAGTSVESYFEPYCMHPGTWELEHARPALVSEVGIVGSRGSAVSDRWYNHMSAQTIRDQLGPDVWSRYFKFCVVRDPFEKAVSAFFHLGLEVGAQELPPLSRLQGQFEQWVLDGKAPMDRDAYLIEGVFALDFAVRFESLELDLKNVCDKLVIPWDKSRLPRWKTEYRPAGYPASALLTAISRRALEEQYAIEFDLFGYRLNAAKTGESVPQETRVTAPLFIDHIPKTAGTSLRMFFTEAFGEANVTPSLIGLKYRDAIGLYADKKVIIGHFDFEPQDSLPSDYLTATVLRNPLDRALSNYYFILEDVPVRKLPSEVKKIKTMDLEEALRAPDLASLYFSNLQCRHFADMVHTSPKHLSDQELFTLARSVLDRYDLVGTTEKLPDFIDKVRELYQLPPDIYLKKFNVTSRRKKLVDLSEETQKYLRSINEADWELWQYADAMFSRKTKVATANDLERTRSNEGSKPEMPTADESVVGSVEGAVELLGVDFLNSQQALSADFMSGEQMTLRVRILFLRDVKDLSIGYRISHPSGLKLFGVNTRLMGARLEAVKGQEEHVDFTFPANLGLGRYSVTVAAHSGLSHQEVCYFWKEKAGWFNIIGYLDVQYDGIVRMLPMVNVSAGVQAVNILTNETGIQSIGLATPEIASADGDMVLLAQVLPVRPGEQFAVPVEVHNHSAQDWQGDGNRPVSICYHWSRLGGGSLVFDGARTPLPGRLVPQGGGVRATAFVEAPREDGEFLLEVTLVQDGVAWLESRGFRSQSVMVVVGRPTERN